MEAIMESRAKILGHSAHQILIVFPLGLLATAVVFDLVAHWNGDGMLAAVAYYMLLAGILGGLVAAPFGFVDWRAIPSGTRAKRIGAAHGTVNAIALVLFVASWWIRPAPADIPPGATVLAVAAAMIAGVGGWLGGELVTRLGVGVDEGAHVDAPSSLSHRPAAEHAGRGRV
jgi:uncharacterized membrane protein